MFGQWSSWPVSFNDQLIHLIKRTESVRERCHAGGAKIVQDSRMIPLLSRTDLFHHFEIVRPKLLPTSKTCKLLVWHFSKGEMRYVKKPVSRIQSAPHTSEETRKVDRRRGEKAKQQKDELNTNTPHDTRHTQATHRLRANCLSKSNSIPTIDLVQVQLLSIIKVFKYLKAARSIRQSKWIFIYPSILSDNISNL